MSFRFSNLLGATYKGGTIQFTPDGNTLLSPVGNRVNCVDLVHGRCSTLAPETNEDIKVFDLSPDGRLLLLIDVIGRGVLVNFVRGSVLSTIRFRENVYSVKWSPDSRWFAIGMNGDSEAWMAPSIELGWEMMCHRTYRGHHGLVSSISWAQNSRFFLTSSKDTSVRLNALYPDSEGFQPMAIVSHVSALVGSFFSADLRYIYSVSRGGDIVTLRFDEDTSEQASSEKHVPLQVKDDDEEADEDAQEKKKKKGRKKKAQGAGKDKAVEEEEEDDEEWPTGGQAWPEEAKPKPKVLEKAIFCKPGKWVVANKAKVQPQKDKPGHVKIGSVGFDANANILACSQSNGIFMLFSVPGMEALQTLSMGQNRLDTISIGAGGDWVAVGSSEVGSLLVWEWRSETYVLKQQGHHWGVNCIAFSPAAASSLKHQKTLANVEVRPEDRGNMMSSRLLATGGYDGKVKLFNSQTGLCFVTFAEHTAPISALCFTPQGNAVLSASKDGSVRAFDLLRYRNFRTFVSPDGLCQFVGLAVDSGGEIVAASASGGNYSIYVWSIQTGNILEVLNSHESDVQSLKFSPAGTHPGQLISAGWDGKVVVWDIYSNKGGQESLHCPSSVLCVAYDPRGNDLMAASCLSGQVLFWNTSTGQTTGSIDGLRDIQSSRRWHDLYSSSYNKSVTAGKSMKKHASETINMNQHYNSIAYARSGELLLCASRNSPHCCLYDTTSYTLATKVTLTLNRSLSGTTMFLDRRAVTKDGVQLRLLDVSDDEKDADVKLLKRRKQAESLPGVTIGEAKDQYSENQLHVWDCGFSGDAQQFAAATTHGVYLYTADLGIGTPSTAASIYGGEFQRFAPQMLTKNVSGPAILKALEKGDLSRAMILALALNDQALVRKVYQSVPMDSIALVVASIGSPLLPALIWFLGSELKPVTGTPHFQFHVHWVVTLIDLHFQTLLELSAGKTTERTGTVLEAAAAARSDTTALCLGLLVELSQRYGAMARTFESNRYLLRYLGSAPTKEEMEARAAKAKEAPEPESTPAKLEAELHRRRKQKQLTAGAADSAAPEQAEEEEEVVKAKVPRGKRRRSSAPAAAEPEPPAEEAPAPAAKGKKAKRRRQSGAASAGDEE